MNGQASLFRRLQRLGSQDRGWIMQQLSSAERAQLTAALTAGDAGEASVQVHSQAQAEATDDSLKTMSRIEPRRLVAVLKEEPSWVVAVLIASQSEPWGKALLDALPSIQRSDVERLWSQRRGYGASLMESVVRLVIARCPPSDLPATSVFDRMVDHLSAVSSKRRSVIHL